MTCVSAFELTRIEVLSSYSSIFGPSVILPPCVAAAAWSVKAVKLDKVAALMHVWGPIHSRRGLILIIHQL